jgi:hypothetical protein
MFVRGLQDRGRTASTASVLQRMAKRDQKGGLNTSSTSCIHRAILRSEQPEQYYKTGLDII